VTRFSRFRWQPSGNTAPFVQTGAETSDTGAKAVEPNPDFSWKGHSRRVGRG